MKGQATRWAFGLLAGITLTAQAAEPSVPGGATAMLGQAIDWAAVQPIASVSVHPMSAVEAPAQYRDHSDYLLIEGSIVDGRSGEMLMQPRLIMRRGEPASIEVGRADRIVMKLTVLVGDGDRLATTVTEIRNAGVLTGASTIRFAFGGF